jgi:hypothetical protein
MPNDPLDPLLDRWAEPIEARRDLAPEIWRRIDHDERARRGTGGFWTELDSWLSRPPFAALFVTCCALLGLFLAEVRLNRQQREQGADLARSYLQLIDPLLKSGTPGKQP